MQCTKELASVAGAVIQATGRLIFEDGLRSFVEVPGPEGVFGVRTRTWKVLEGSGIGGN